jgi:predicted RNA-binding Zn-ribbon protein involved in translation (DUF1610 family)
MSLMVFVGVALLLTLLTALYVLHPVIRASALGQRYFREAAASDRLADLLARRDAIYQAIRDLDFDHETGKLTAEDHRVMRAQLMAEGVAVLQELDRVMELASPEDLEAEIEREVARLRQRRAAPVAEPAATPVGDVKDAPVGVRTCPECGQQAPADAAFCVHCGAALEFVAEREDNVCPACGASFQEGDRYCRACGAALSGAGASEVVRADGDGA